MQKRKSLNLGPKMPYLGIWGSHFVKLLSYLKSAPLNSSNCKISREKKKSKCDIKNDLFRYF